VKVLEATEAKKRPGLQQVEAEMKLSATGAAPDEPPDE